MTAWAYVPKSRQPDNEVGIYLSRHKHLWNEVGSHSWPNGTSEPVFRCVTCGDVICTKAAPAVVSRAGVAAGGEG